MRYVSLFSGIEAYDTLHYDEVGLWQATTQ